MSLSNKCESCSVSVHLSEQEIDSLFKKIADADNTKIVNEDEYDRRINICMGCESLMYNTTCRHCGCIIQIKAMLEHAVCPYPYQPKW